MTDPPTAAGAGSEAVRALAAKHGLRVAGERPGIVEYTRTLWYYRHFVATYADAKLAASFDTARLGRLWQVLTPLTNAAVYYLIFGVILNTRSGVPDFVAYLCIGLFVFNFTQTVMLSGVQSISSSLGLIRSIHFPRACLPIAATLTQAQNMLVSVLVLGGIVLLNGVPLSPMWLLAIPSVLLQSVFNTGLALIFARLGTTVTDLKQILPFIIRTWMYGSGVFYSVQNYTENLPDVANAIISANPMLVYIELVRDALLESAPLSSTTTQLWVLGVIWAFVVFIGGYVYFWRGEQDYGRG